MPNAIRAAGASLETTIRNAKEERPYTVEQLAERVDETLQAYYAERAKVAVTLKALAVAWQYDVEKVCNDPAAERHAIPIGTRARIVKLDQRGHCKIRFADGTEKRVSAALAQWAHCPADVARLPPIPPTDDDLFADDDDSGGDTAEDFIYGWETRR